MLINESMKFLRNVSEEKVDDECQILRIASCLSLRLVDYGFSLYSLPSSDELLSAFENPPCSLDNVAREFNYYEQFLDLDTYKGFAYH